jgi:hypothetical protein
MAAVVLVQPAYRDQDVELTLDVAACPACARRPRGLIRSVLNVLGGSAGIFVIAAYATDQILVTAGAAAIAALGGVLFEIRRWRAGGRVRVVRQLREPRWLPMPVARQLRR